MGISRLLLLAFWSSHLNQGTCTTVDTNFRLIGQGVKSANAETCETRLTATTAPRQVLPRPLPLASAVYREASNRSLSRCSEFPGGAIDSQRGTPRPPC